MSGETVVLARKRKARSEMQNHISLLSICFIATLVVLMLLLVSDEFAEATAQLGLY